MSKIISDEEIVAYRQTPTFGDLFKVLGKEIDGKPTKTEIAIAQAQALSSDREWVEWLEANSDDEGFKAMFYLCIPLEKWQALKKSAEGIDP